MSAKALHELVLKARKFLGEQKEVRELPNADKLLEAFTPGMPLLPGAAQVGDPVAVLPVAYHLLWRRELACDMSVPGWNWSLIIAAPWIDFDSTCSMPATNRK